MNRPDKLNAQNPTLITELDATFAAGAADREWLSVGRRRWMRGRVQTMGDSGRCGRGAAAFGAARVRELASPAPLRPPRTLLATPARPTYTPVLRPLRRGRRASLEGNSACLALEAPSRPHAQPRRRMYTPSAFCGLSG